MTLEKKDTVYETDGHRDSLAENAESKASDRDEISRLLEKIQENDPGNAGEKPVEQKRTESDGKQGKGTESQGKTDVQIMSEQDRSEEPDGDRGNISEDAEGDDNIRRGADKEEEGDHHEKSQAMEAGETLQVGEMDKGEDNGFQVLGPDEESEFRKNYEQSNTENKKSRMSQETDKGGEGERDSDIIEGKKVKKGRKVLFVASGITAAILLIFIFSGLLIYKDKQNSEHKKDKQSSYVETTQKSWGKLDIEEPIPEKKEPEPEILTPVRQKLSEIVSLRKRVVAKQKSIADLKQYYEEGIDEAGSEILKEMKEKGVTSYEDALKEKSIELNLRTIQRRHAYIRELDWILSQLVLYSEELLYEERQAEIDDLMVNVIKGKDIEKLVESMDAVIQKHLHYDDKLTMDINDVRGEPLATIWKAISEEKRQSGKQKTSLSEEERTNREIWHEICEGNFDRRYELSSLSLEAAKCLSKWKGKDLFLGKLMSLSPEEARYLSQWKGNWLALNGLTKISPVVAKYLSQWQGDTLSLNGLRELSPGVAEYLSQWRGKELELVNLQSVARWDKSGSKIIMNRQARGTDIGATRQPD